MARPHRRGITHRNAEALIDYLMKHNGSAHDAGTDIAKDMGWSINQFHDARRHTLTCPDLGGYVVAYRAKGAAMVLFDPNLSAASLRALTDRSGPFYLGFNAAIRLMATWTERLATLLDVASKDAASRGEKAMAVALDIAAADVRKTGDIQPGTRALLESLITSWV